MQPKKWIVVIRFTSYIEATMMFNVYAMSSKEALDMALGYVNTDILNHEEYDFEVRRDGS